MNIYEIKIRLIFLKMQMIESVLLSLIYYLYTILKTLNLFILVATDNTIIIRMS